MIDEEGGENGIFRERKKKKEKIFAFTRFQIKSYETTRVKRRLHTLPRAAAAVVVVVVENKQINKQTTKNGIKKRKQ